MGVGRQDRDVGDGRTEASPLGVLSGAIDDDAGQTAQQVGVGLDHMVEGLAPDLHQHAVAGGVHGRGAGFSGQQAYLADGLPGQDLAERFYGSGFGVAGVDAQSPVQEHIEAVAGVALFKEHLAAGQKLRLRVGRDDGERGVAQLAEDSREGFPDRRVLVNLSAEVAHSVREMSTRGGRFGRSCYGRARAGAS